MEIREIRSLTSLAEIGSIARVAELLHMSPAAVHKQLKTLERELGAPLYERVGARLQLTRGGELLLPYFRDLLAQHDAALSAFDEWKGSRKGLIRIGAGPTLSSYILPPILKPFHSRFPHVDLVVETGHSRALLDGVENGVIDLAVLVSEDLLSERNVVMRRSWDFEIVFVSSLKNVPRKCALPELSRYPLILFKKGSRIENVIDRYFTELNFRPRVIMRFDSAEAIRTMIRSGLGISMLPYWTVEEDVKRKELMLIRQSEPPLFSKIVLVGRKSAYVPRAVEAFIELAQKFEYRRPHLKTRSS